MTDQTQSATQPESDVTRALAAYKAALKAGKAAEAEQTAADDEYREHVERYQQATAQSDKVRKDTTSALDALHDALLAEKDTPQTGATQPGTGPDGRPSATGQPGVEDALKVQIVTPTSPEATREPSRGPIPAPSPEDPNRMREPTPGESAPGVGVSAPLGPTAGTGAPAPAPGDAGHPAAPPS